jgi:hypothetical protein
VSTDRIIGLIFFEDIINSGRYAEQILCPFFEWLPGKEIPACILPTKFSTDLATRSSIDTLRKVSRDRIISGGV